jgi:hypothetical protein
MHGKEPSTLVPVDFFFLEFRQISRTETKAKIKFKHLGCGLEQL